MLTPAEVLKYLDSDPMPCLICGRKFQNVGSHATQMHGFESVRGYCEEFGIPYSLNGAYGVLTKALRERMAAASSTAENLERLRTMRLLRDPSKEPPHDRECYGVSKVLRDVKDQRDGPPLARKLYRCEWCDEEFSPRETVTRFCSGSCAMKHRSANDPNLPTPVTPCVECGEPYKPLRRGLCNKCRQRKAYRQRRMAQGKKPRLFRTVLGGDT